LGRGQDINSLFQVLKLPRLIIVKSDTTIYMDALFLKSDELKTEIDKLLKETYTEKQAEVKSSNK
jgi:hypothetical protein